MRFLIKLFLLLSSHTILSNGRPDEIDPSKVMKTGLDINVMHHKNFRLLPSLHECGVSSLHHMKDHRRHKRVVGGKPVVNGRHPWMVMIHLHNTSSGISEFHCGGSLITKNVILTAAHCVTRILSGTSLSAVMYGEVDRRNIKVCENEAEKNCSKENQREINELVIHEHYSEGNLINDIALIKLNYDLTFNTTARPICLPYTEKLLRHWTTSDLTVVGWGTVNKFDDPGPKQMSNVLEEVNIPLRKRHYCDRFHTRTYGKLTKNRFCAGGIAGKDTCSGDSGGAVSHALKLHGAKRYFQFGIVSSGHVALCGWQGRPSIYTNVLYYMPWILDHLGTKRPKNSGVSTIPLNKVYRKHEPIYMNELSTGLDIDERDNPRRDLLPSNCGSWTNVHITEDHIDKNPPPRVKRVIGGRPAGGIARFPFMAQLYIRNILTEKLELRCSGTVINSRHILTTAHCVSEIEGPFVLDSVILGNYNRNLTKECMIKNDSDCSKAFRPQIDQVVIHEKYEKYTHMNNIALIRLKEDLNFNTSFIQPICIPLYENITSYLKTFEFTSAGWGRVNTDENIPPSNLLHSIQVNLTEREDCDSVFTRLWGKLDRDRICSGGVPGIGECKGDGGSPLMRPLGEDQSVFQFGMLSFSECAQQGIPSVYTNLLYYIPWILRNLA